MQTDTFKDRVVIVTGGANGIGRCIADEFRSQRAVVYVIDKQEGEHFVGDISKKEALEAFAAEVLSKHSKVDIIINNALPLMKGIDECSYDEFQYALSVGVTAPFYLVKLFMSHLAEGVKWRVHLDWQLKFALQYQMYVLGNPAGGTKKPYRAYTGEVLPGDWTFDASRENLVFDKSGEMQYRPEWELKYSDLPKGFGAGHNIVASICVIYTLGVERTVTTIF